MMLKLKIQAFAIHFVASLCIASVLILVVYRIWYPGAIANISGITQILLLLLFIDIGLGPILTLIIYAPHKKGLKFDLTLIIIAQLVALSYGTYTIFITRPVYIVFNVDRFDLVYANDFSQEELKTTELSEYSSLPYLGPDIIAATIPSDPHLAHKITVNALSGGKDIAQLLERYTTYNSQKELVLNKIMPLAQLLTLNSSSQKAQLLTRHYQDDDVGYLALVRQNKAVAVIVSRDSAEVLEITDLKTF